MIFRTLARYGDCLTSVGTAFHARGPATEKALSARCSYVRLTAKLHRSCNPAKMDVVPFGMKAY